MIDVPEARLITPVLIQVSVIDYTEARLYAPAMRLESIRIPFSVAISTPGNSTWLLLMYMGALAEKYI